MVHGEGGPYAGFQEADHAFPEARGVLDEVNGGAQKAQEIAARRLLDHGFCYLLLHDFNLRGVSSPEGYVLWQTGVPDVAV